jgi:hypothetical protein
MTTKNHEGELSEQQLDDIAGGQQQVVKMGTIVVEGKRLKPEAKPQQVVKMETIVVTAQREKPDLAGAKLAQSEARNKKD